MQVGVPLGWSLARPREDREDRDRGVPRGDGPRYPYGFFARYLRDYVFDKMDAEGWRQYQVAEWIGIPDDALSVYLNRHAHPTAERRRLLSRLGCREEEMQEAELLDKLDLWMRTHGVGPTDVHHFLERMRARDSRAAARRARERAVSLEAVTSPGASD